MNESVALRPLHCTGCGAFLALGQGKTSRCGYCGTDTPIPEEYGALQRAAHSFAADKKLAEQLYGSIGKPPGWMARTWGSGAEGSVHVSTMVGGALLAIAVGYPPIGVALGAAAAYALGYPVAMVIRAAAWVAGAPIGGQLSPYLVLSLATLVFALLVGVPAILVDKERTLAGVRRDIQASLAAALPERPGGPSRCRSCGAALDIPRDALGVPCPYCRTDNLVALPQPWVTQIRASEFKHFMRIDAALEAFRQASVTAHERLWKLIFGLIFVFPLVMAVAWLLTKMKIGF